MRDVRAGLGVEDFLQHQLQVVKALGQRAPGVQQVGEVLQGQRPCAGDSERGGLEAEDPTAQGRVPQTAPNVSADAQASPPGGHQDRVPPRGASAGPAPVQGVQRPACDPVAGLVAGRVLRHCPLDVDDRASRLQYLHQLRVFCLGGEALLYAAERAGEAFDCDHVLYAYGDAVQVASLLP